MKLGYSLGIFAALLFVFPSISEARQGEPPRSCMRNGYFDCSASGGGDCPLLAPCAEIYGNI